MNRDHSDGVLNINHGASFVCVNHGDGIVSIYQVDPGSVNVDHHGDNIVRINCAESLLNKDNVEDGVKIDHVEKAVM